MQQVHLANLNSDLDKLNIDQNVATNLSNLKNKVDKFDLIKLELI